MRGDLEVSFWQFGPRIYLFVQLEKKKTYNWKIISFRREPSLQRSLQQIWVYLAGQGAHCGPLWPPKVHGSAVRSLCLTSRSYLYLPLSSNLRLFFLYSCFSVCQKRRGKSIVVIAYLSTSLLYVLVTQGNEHFGSFLLCEEAFDCWEVVRIIEGPFNSWVGVDFLLIFVLVNAGLQIAN